MAGTERRGDGNGLAVVLGSGLGSVCAGWPPKAEIPFERIPGMGFGGVDGHEGVLRTCDVDGRECFFAVGRRHYYEGGEEPVRALIEHLAGLGASRLLLTSAAGSLTPAIRPGDIAVADGLLDLQFRGFSRPAELSGSAEQELSRPGARPLLDPDFTGLVRRAASLASIPVERGIMAAMHGPTYETPAEVRMLQEMGARFATMSAAPELAHAAGRGIPAAALAIITNYATGVSSAPLSHDEVLKAGESAAAQVRSIIRQFVVIM